jgi:hypothetical protein
MSLVFVLQFFTTEPYACEPSSLPKYPPSKELDVKLRDEEARRLVYLSLSPTIFGFGPVFLAIC